MRQEQPKTESVRVMREELVLNIYLLVSRMQLNGFRVGVPALAT